MSVLPKLLNWNVNNRFLCPVSGWPLQVSSVLIHFQSHCHLQLSLLTGCFHSLKEVLDPGWIHHLVHLSPFHLKQLRREKWGRIAVIERQYIINFNFKSNKKHRTSLDIQSYLENLLHVFHLGHYHWYHGPYSNVGILQCLHFQCMFLRIG